MDIRRHMIGYDQLVSSKSPVSPAGSSELLQSGLACDIRISLRRYGDLDDTNWVVANHMTTNIPFKLIMGWAGLVWIVTMDCTQSPTYARIPALIGEHSCEISYFGEGTSMQRATRDR